jgi:hypothetical protein
MLTPLIRPLAVTISANHIAFGYFGLQLLPRQSRAACCDCKVKALDFSRPVVEIHDVVGIPMTAVRTRNILGLTNGTTVSLDSLVL